MAVKLWLNSWFEQTNYRVIVVLDARGDSGSQQRRSVKHELSMAPMNLTAHERKTQGQRGQTTRGGASYFSPRGLWGILYPDTFLKPKRGHGESNIEGGEIIIFPRSAVLHSFCCRIVIASQKCPRRVIFFTPSSNMQFVCIWERFPGAKTNQSNLYPVEVSVHDEPPLETEMVLPPSSLTNGAAVERPL